MLQEERQEIINNLSFIGYYANEEHKDSVFLAIAAMYRISDDKALILKNKVDSINKGESNWDPDIINLIA